jgi:hypothetical protein
MAEQEMEALFEVTPIKEQPELFKSLEIEEEPEGPDPMIRCACGALVRVTMPCLCPKCHSVKAFWREKDGSTIALSKLDLGRLTMIGRTLGERAEKYRSSWPEHYQQIEIALDIVFAEISSRDKEIDQQRSILSGLMKGLNA